MSTIRVSVTMLLYRFCMSCKFLRLMELLEEIGNQDENKTIIFAETKKNVRSLYVHGPIFEKRILHSASTVIITTCRFILL